MHQQKKHVTKQIKIPIYNQMRLCYKKLLLSNTLNTQ